MRIAFMGTPEFAVPTLDALLAAGHEVAAVYTQPPRPAGRGKRLLPSPVQKRAEAAGLEVRTPVSLRNAEAQAAFAALELDAAVVAAYGLILPEPILNAPKHGCINVHASLLPRWRGAAPIQRAILAGDTQTGITIMQMEKGLDTGPMLAALPVAIDSKTAGDLTAELATLGARLLVQVLDQLPGMAPVPQDDGDATYAPKVEKGEARLDLTKSATEVERQIRAFNPAPGAWFELNGERIKVLSAVVVRCHRGWDLRPRPGYEWTIDGRGINDAGAIRCRSGFLVPRTVQPAGKSPMPWQDFLRGYRPAARRGA